MIFGYPVWQWAVLAYFLVAIMVGNTYLVHAQKHAGTRYVFGIYLWPLAWLNIILKKCSRAEKTRCG